MTTRFTGDPKIVAGLPPFHSMGQDSPPAGTHLGEEMREFVSQGAVNLGRAVIAQARIQRDKFVLELRAAGGAAQTRVPFDTDERRKLGSADGF